MPHPAAHSGIPSSLLSSGTFRIPESPTPPRFQTLCLIITLLLYLSDPSISSLSFLPLTLNMMTASTPCSNTFLRSEKELGVPLSAPTEPNEHGSYTASASESPAPLPPTPQHTYTHNQKCAGARLKCLYFKRLNALYFQGRQNPAPGAEPSLEPEPWVQCCSGTPPVTLKDMCTLSTWPVPVSKERQSGAWRHVR